MTPQLEKSLTIEKAEEGESIGLQTIDTYEKFKYELDINGVDDIFNDTQIKEDQLKYIFMIGGSRKFNIDIRKLEDWTQKFYNDKQQNDIDIRITKVQGILTLEYIRNELGGLKEEAENVSIENIKGKIDRLITFFEQEKDLTNENIGQFLRRQYDRKDTQFLKITKIEIKRRIDQLKKMKKQIERLEKNKDKRYTIKRENDGEVEVKMDDINGFDMSTTLSQFNQKIEELGKEAPEFIKTRNEIVLGNGDTTPYFEIIGYTTSDAQKLSKALRKVNNEYAILDELKLTGAKRQELSQDLQAMEEYLNNVINNPGTFKPSEHPFIPEHTEEFCALLKIQPTPGQYATANENADQTQVDNNTSGVETDNTNTNNETNEETREYTTSPYSSPGEAFEKGGIGGILKYGLDQTKMKPSQKQFRGGVGNVALIGGIAVLGFKMLQSAFRIVFKKDGYKDSKNRGWLLGPLAVLGISQGVSGEGPLSLFKGGKLTEIIASIWGGGDKNNNNEETETGIKYSEGFPGVTAIFNGFTYGGMKELLVQDTDEDHIKINPDKYDALLETFKNGPKKNEAAVKFLESIGKDDDKNMIDLALKGMLGKDARDKIHDDKDKDKTFNESASKSIARLASVSEYMTEKGYNKINTETEYLIEEYIADEDADISDLNDLDKRGDVFYKESTIIDTTGLTEEVKTLAKGNIETEEELLLALNTFHKNMKTADDKIEIIGNGPEISFKTYDQTTTINIEDKKLVGFTPDTFSSYYELFKAANLTNYIKKICKDKTANSEKPFTISTVGRDIEFDDAKIFSTSFDTEIVSAGPGGSLNDISPTLEKFKQKYCDYLNTITPKIWKETVA